MSIFPQTHENFLDWSKGIASSLEASTKGKCRVGFNKLAAIMASTLPGTNSDFNINTLKSVLDGNKQAPAIQKPDNTVTVPAGGKYNDFLAVLKIDMSHAVYEWVDKIVYLLKHGVDNSIYDAINEEDELSEFYKDFHEINDETFAIASKSLTELDPSRLDSVYKEYVMEAPGFLSKDFTYVHYKTIGYAYREYLMDTIYSFFDELASQHHELEEVKKMDDKQLAKWVGQSFELWDGIEEFRPSKDSPCFKQAIDEVLDPIQYEYEVVVRAVISGDEDFLQDWEMPTEWQGYDFVAGDDDTDAVRRADCIVTVEAPDLNTAVERAKDDAPGLQLHSEMANIELWVDTEQPSDIKQGKVLPRI